MVGTPSGPMAIGKEPYFKILTPILNDLNFVPIDFDEKCDYLNADLILERVYY